MLKTHNSFLFHPIIIHFVWCVRLKVKSEDGVIFFVTGALEKIHYIF